MVLYYALLVQVFDCKLSSLPSEKAHECTFVHREHLHSAYFTILLKEIDQVLLFKALAYSSDEQRRYFKVGRWRWHSLLAHIAQDAFSDWVVFALETVTDSFLQLSLLEEGRGIDVLVAVWTRPAAITLAFCVERAG